MSNKQPTLVFIHPNTSFVNDYKARLEAQGFLVVTAQDGSEGIKTIYNIIPDLVIADIMLPEINGYQICRLIKNDPCMQKLPFILISDFDEKMEKFWGVKAGADLFLNHDELDVKLVKQVQTLLDMYGQLSPTEKKQLVQRHNHSAVQFSTRLNQILDKSLIESTLMIDFRNLVDMIHEPNLINHMLFSLLEGIIDYDAAAIFYNDKTRSPRLLTVHIPEGRNQHTQKIEELQKQFFAPLQEQYPENRLFDLHDLEVIGNTDPETPADEYRTVYSRVFYHNNELIGVFCLYAKEPVDFANIFPVRLIEDELYLLMKVRYLFSKAEMLAVTDDLTGLYNYNQFMMTLDREFKASKRYEHPLSIAIIDVDEIEKYNALWGYTEGDELIKKVAQLTQINFRGIDVIARMGGVELVVMFPKTSHDQAMQALTRFQEKVTHIEGVKSPISVSIGLAVLSEDMEKPSDLLTKAREALDEAFTKGKNSIAIKQA